MKRSVMACELIEGYRVYAELLNAAGHTVDREAVAEYLAEDEERRDEVAELLARPPDQAHNGEKVSAQLADRMRELCRALMEEFGRVAAERFGEPALPTGADALVEGLKARPESDREAFADAVLLNGHRGFTRPRYISAGEFQRVLGERADGGEPALVKFAPFLRAELAKRGLAMSDAEVRALFDPSCEDRQVPYCLKRILEGVNGDFNAGLIRLEEMVGDQDPDEWLEAVRHKLQFRSHSSMHKAIAEATSLKYDCVHKALSGQRKAKRVRAEIKYCLANWLADVEEGREPEIPEDYRGVPVERMHELLSQLERRFDTKEDIYRLISDRTGIKTGSVRRYFQGNGQLKYAPLAVFRCARRMAVEDVHVPGPGSYLADGRIRRLARSLAGKSNEALRRWRSAGENHELEMAYKELRRALIVTIKEQRHIASALP